MVEATYYIFSHWSHLNPYLLLERSILLVKCIFIGIYFYILNFACIAIYFRDIHGFETLLL